MSTEAPTWVHVDFDRQRLTLYAGTDRVAQWPCSTARNGPGEQVDSGCTPRGEHRVRLLIGDGCAPNTVFVARRPTGELYTPVLARDCPGRDWILTRVIWLTGAQPGVNRGGRCDTLRRFIYIHGCPDSEPMGVPLSHGCIRMRNADVIALFEHLHNGDRVLIGDSA